MLPISSYEANITLITKPDNNNTRKENYNLITFMKYTFILDSHTYIYKYLYIFVPGCICEYVYII